MISTDLPSTWTSSAPASIAARPTSSGSFLPALAVMTPLRSNIQPTELDSPRFPPNFENRWRIEAEVRLRLSVKASTITATPAGP